MTMDVERRNFEMSIPVTRAFSLLVFSVRAPHTNLFRAFPNSTVFHDTYVSLDIIRLPHAAFRSDITFKGQSRLSNVLHLHLQSFTFV